MDISNNLLAALVIVAMAISVAGTMSIVSLAPQPYSMTGLAAVTQESGSTNVSVSAEVIIVMDVDIVNFGTIGARESNVTKGLVTAASPSTANHPLVVKNIGSIPCNISMGMNSDLLWDVLTGVGTGTSIYFQYNTTKNLSGTTYIWACCPSDPTDGLRNVLNFTTGYSNTDFNSTQVNLVYNLSSTNPLQNFLNIELNITVPAGEPTGPKGTTLLFIAGAG